MRDFPLQACNTLKCLTSYWSFLKETPALKFRLGFFSFGRKSHSSPHHACATFWLWRMRDVWLMSTCHGVVADEEKLSRCKTRHCIIRSKRIQDMHTSFAIDLHEKMSSVFGTSRSANLTRDLFMSENLWVNLSSRNMLYQLSYLMLIERSIDANLIVYLDVIVNQAEYQFKVWKG